MREITEEMLLIDRFRSEVESKLLEYTKSKANLSVRRSKDILHIQGVLKSAENFEVCKENLKKYIENMHTGLRIFEILGLKSFETGNSVLKNNIMDIIKRYEDVGFRFEHQNHISVLQQLQELQAQKMTPPDKRIETQHNEIIRLKTLLSEKQDEIIVLKKEVSDKDEIIEELQKKNHSLAYKLSGYMNPRRTFINDDDTNDFTLNSLPNNNNRHYFLAN